jgi:signal transduction histidine kinase/CheY-like chemotaxis protein
VQFAVARAAAPRYPPAADNASAARSIVGPARMKIHHRFLIFLLVSIAVYAVALHVLRGGAERIGGTLLDLELHEQATHLGQVIDLERAPLEKGIYDNTFWDDMVAFVFRPKAEWAKENIDQGFPNFGVQFVWVYDANLRPVYAMPSTRLDPAQVQLSSDELRAAVGGSWFEHFYAERSGGELIEYFTAPIQPSADNERHTPPQGFLVGARRIDQPYLNRIGSITGSAVAVEAPVAEPRLNRADPTTGSIDVFVPLADLHGAPRMLLHAHRVNDGLHLLRSSLDRYHAIYLGFAAIFLGLLAVFIFTWVRIPLQRISESLDRQDLAPVARYLDTRHEFGTLARLIRSFFQQREALVTELEMHKQYEAHLREARDQADAGARAKANFLSVMSHELRTPLNGVIGLTSLLLDEDPRPDQTENLTALKYSAESLLALINDVLDINKMEAGKLVLEQREIDLPASIDNLIRVFAPQARAKRLALKGEVAPDIPKWVMGDALRLSQVFTNLLANAFKFTEEGSVTLAAAVAGESEDRVRIAFRVADTGIGIAPEKQAQVFEVFTQAESDTARRYGGTGLGLTIVKKVLELMGSTISFESAPGQGSTFKFEVSFLRASAPRLPASTVAAARTELEGTRILVVEDNGVNRRLAVVLLHRWGCVVDTAESGVEAVEKAAAHPYDLILMDLQMPKMSGIEATAQIRSSLRGPNVRTLILAFTATTPSETLPDIEGAGFDDCIAKPIDPDRLRQILERNLAKMMPSQTRTG